MKDWSDKFASDRVQYLHYLYCRGTHCGVRQVEDENDYWGMHLEAPIYITGLVTVMLLAFAVPPLLSRIKMIRIPSAVGEVLAGVIVGQSGLKLLSPDPSLDVLQFLGLLYLMFAAGVEVDFRALSGGDTGSSSHDAQGGKVNGRTGGSAFLARLHHPLYLGVLFNFITVILAYLWAAHFTDRSLIPYPLPFAFLMATVGFSIIMPVLKETERLATPFGQILVAVAAIGDFVPVIAMTVLVTLHHRGTAHDLLLLVALFLAALAFYFVARRFRNVQAFGGLTQGTTQIDVRGATLLMLAFGLLAQWLNVEIILGAFLAGLLISALVGERREELIHKMDAVGFGFLIPIFFVMVGVNFDLSVLFANPAALAFVPVLLFVLIVIKAGPALLLRLWHPWRLTLAGSALLTSQMSVTVAFSSVLLLAGMIGEAIHAAVVLTAILTAIIGPVLYIRLLPDAPREKPRSGVILVGAGRESILIARNLQETGEPFVLVDTDAEKVAAARQAGLHVIEADATREDVQERLGAATARVMVALTGSDEVNLAACRLAAERFGVERTVAVIRNSAYMDEVRWPGLEMINPGLATAALIEMMVTSPATAGLLAGNTKEHRLIDVRLRNPRFAGRRLRDAGVPAEILIVSVLRGNERILPHGDTVLRLGDILSVAGPAKELELARKLFT